MNEMNDIEFSIQIRSYTRFHLMPHTKTGTRARHDAFTYIKTKTKRIHKQVNHRTVTANSEIVAMRISM